MMVDKAQKLRSRLRRSGDTETFNPSRLTLARKRRGLAKLALADLIGVDRKTVHSYETGITVPEDVVLGEIVTALEFPREFFFGDDIEEPSVLSGSFRSMSKMSAPLRDMAQSQAAFGLHLSMWLKRKFELPSVQLPDISLTSDPEAAAEFVRRTWALGNLSIRNMIHLLESKGVRVFSLALDAREVDAYSMWTDGVPYVFLNNNKSSEHSRFDAAHELGHLVLHKHGTPRGIEAEKQAHTFASAFLMPRGSVFAHAPRFPTYNTLVALKKVWITSVAALAYRLHELDLMTDWQYRGICIEIAKRGRDKEPASAPRETSIVLPQIFASLYRDGINRSQVAKELAIPTSELEQLLFGLTMTGIIGGGKRTATKDAELSRV
jgi:Zn-dependent peptidase ImmA (M78 family)/transcriptional regulator with XRE-family HTH domain